MKITGRDMLAALLGASAVEAVNKLSGKTPLEHGAEALGNRSRKTPLEPGAEEFSRKIRDLTGSDYFTPELLSDAKRQRRELRQEEAEAKARASGIREGFALASDSWEVLLDAYMSALAYTLEAMAKDSDCDLRAELGKRGLTMETAFLDDTYRSIFVKVGTGLIRKAPMPGSYERYGEESDWRSFQETMAKLLEERIAEATRSWRAKM